MISAHITAAVSVVVNSMTADELRRFYLAVTLDYNHGHVSRLPGYDKIASLYTEQNGTAMHPVTRQAFMQLAVARF